MNRYDIVVIGGGPGGYAAALRGVARGLKVALIEKDYLGGTCLNRGCVPAKSWIAAAETVDMAKHMASLATKPFDYSVDYGKMATKQKIIVGQFRKSLTTLLEKKGVHVIRGMGEFASHDTVTVNGEQLHFKNAVIATGTSPAKIFDLDPSLMMDNESLFEQDSLPESLLIVGAGVIGCETASAMARFGVKVTLVEFLPRILPMEDHEISATLEREFRKLKINIITSDKLTSLEPSPEGVTGKLLDGKTVSAKKAMMSIGRTFNTAGLGLEKIGIHMGKKGEIVTDAMMRTSAPHIFAVGDVAGKHLLAYTAYKEGCLAADICAGIHVDYKHVTVPNAIFTIPEIGSVGVTEEKAPRYAKKGSFMFRGLARAHCAGEIAGLVKIIADGTNDKLLGVHIIGPRATDMIHIASIAIAKEMTASELGDMLFAHPTFAEAIMEAVHDVHGLSLHK